MKKTMILAAAAAMFMFSSCQKEEVMPVQSSQSDELVFSAAIIDKATRTTVDMDASSANRGKVSWEVNDEISVTDGENTAVYYIAEDGDIATDGSATFTYKSGDRPSSSASGYTATYGNAITTVQTYSDAVGNLPMRGESDSGNKTKLNFTVTCGLLKLNLTASGDNTKDISKIEIVGTPTGKSATVYTLNCNNESIASAKDFYIALPAGSYSLMKFTNSKGCVCIKKATEAMDIEANKIQPVTLSGITFSALLPGKFQVSNGDNYVNFTVANLYWDGSDYAFESSQTAYPTSWNANHVGHFYWAQTADAAYAQTYNVSSISSSDKFFCGVDNPISVDGQSGLYTLHGGTDTGTEYGNEWYWILIGRYNVGTKCKYNVTVNGITTCLVIAPDGYSGTIAESYDAAAWLIAEAAGLVCLPPAGYREGQTCDTGGLGFYCSSSLRSQNLPYYLYFKSMDSKSGDAVQPAKYNEHRYCGMAIRLVKKAN